MNQRNDGNRALWFILLFLLSLVFFSTFSGTLLVIGLLLAAFWALRNLDLNNVNRNFDFLRSSSSRSALEEEYYDEEFEEDDEPATQDIQREPIYRHALSAVENAGLNPDNIQVLAVDLGVLAYRGDEKPSVYRTWTVPDDVEYLQPFVQLRLPTHANGKIRFELVDNQGKVMFVHENNYALEKGRNFISPPARMPLKDERAYAGRWQLKILADNVLLAVHRFEFAEATTSRIRSHIAEDGELNADTRLVMDENPLPKMSLDDLLSFQDDEEERRAK